VHSRETLNVRVRGIYATALSTWLSEQGFRVVEASPVIAERLGLSCDGTADVRLRDRPDHQGVRLEGARSGCAALARRLAELLPDAVPRALRGGPASWEVEFPAGSKRALDAVRASVWPTLPGHHQLKIVAQEAVDRAERELAPGHASAESLAAELHQRFIIDALRPGRQVVAEHVKPDGRELKLPGRVASLEGGRLCLTRSFRQGGTYDSLNAPRRGDDYGEIEQLEGSWVSRRRYLRASGALIGELYNIQTPTELYPHGVRYLDLEVDVARWPDSRVEVVDRPDLDQAVRAGFIQPKLATKALEVAESVQVALRRDGEISIGDWR
jgi:hypothetical protein